MDNKLGFHAGPACRCNGIGDFWKQLMLAGERIVHKSADEYGTIFEALSHDPGAITVYRMSTKGQNDGFDYDVPAYHLDPVAAAHWHWEQTKKNLPPEFDKRTWVEPINEVDKNRADWLGKFALELAQVANAEGYRVALFGWSSGEPEIQHWMTDGIYEYLKYCAENPDMAGVAIHEYSYTRDAIFSKKVGDKFEPAEFPSGLVGRFLDLHRVCDEFDLDYPTIFITEFGWTLNDVPSADMAMKHLKQAADLYAPYDNIKMAAIWYLGGGANWSGIGEKAQKLIKPLGDLIVNYTPPTAPPYVPDPVPSPPAVPSHDDRLDAVELRLKLIDEMVHDRFATVEEQLDALYEALKGEPPVDPTPDPSPIYVGHGVDVSHWQGSIDWEKVFEKAEYAFIKASEGRAWVDPMFHKNWKEADAAGVLRGAYHYYKNNVSPLEQARHFVSVLGDDLGELPMVLDVEDTDGSVNAGAVLQCLKEIERLTNRKPMIYTGAWFWDARIGIAGWENEYDLWVASYSDTPRPVKAWDSWLFWQYTSKGDGKAYGVQSGNIDLNRFNGDFDAYLDGLKWDDVPPSPPAPPAPPKKEYAMDEYLCIEKEGFGPLYEVQTIGGGQERHQTQKVKNNVFYHTKNGNWEELWFDGSFIYRRTDTSHGEMTFYQLHDGADGAFSKWMPRFWSVGDVFKRSPNVVVREKATCKEISRNNNVVSYIRFAGRSETFLFESGVKLNDVIYLEASWDKDGFRPFEGYYYTRGYGLVGWYSIDSNTGEILKRSGISEIHDAGARPNNVRQVIGCLS